MTIFVIISQDQMNTKIIESQIKSQIQIVDGLNRMVICIRVGQSWVRVTYYMWFMIVIFYRLDYPFQP